MICALKRSPCLVGEVEGKAESRSRSHLPVRDYEKFDKKVTQALCISGKVADRTSHLGSVASAGSSNFRFSGY